MKYLLLSLSLLPTPVLSQSISGTIIDHFRTETVSTPTRVNECLDIEVPIYSQGPASTGDALAGAIIGGVIGNQFGEGKGKDAMTILGAIAGADAANKKGNKQIVGYRTERQCSEVVRYKDETIQTYSHSTITFVVNNKRYKIDFVK